MSKIGKKIIKKRSISKTLYKGGVFRIEGKYGILTLKISSKINLMINNNLISLKPMVTIKKVLSLWGLLRTLVYNLVTGIENIFLKRLKIIGIGYSAKNINTCLLIITIGYSHEILYHAPSTIRIKCHKNHIDVYGCNKYLVGQVCFDIKKLKKITPYIDKGIRYHKELFIKKIGKKK